MRCAAERGADIAARCPSEGTDLPAPRGVSYVPRMKFFGAILAYLLIAAVLGWGIWLGAAKGNWWLLAIGFLVYVVSFAKIGCLPSGKSH